MTFKQAFLLLGVILLVEPGVPAAHAVDNRSMLGSFLDAGMPDEILFAVRKPSTDGHWYANIAYYSTDQCRTTFPMNSGGKLCIYNVKTKEVRTILEDPEGNIRDPQIHYDAKRLIFAYLPKGKRHYSLYEINLDGKGLKQLTGRGEDVSPGMEDYSIYSPPGWDDFEPTYLPNDQIIFCSTRANRYVQCWLTQVGTLYKCDADGSNLRALSANVEHDNTPWVLSSGQVAYMRWEYVDRFHMGYHHLWSMNPDGTRQMVLYGNQINHGTILAPKPVPHSPKLVVTWSPGHGMREHYGRVALVDPRLGRPQGRSVHQSGQCPLRPMGAERKPLSGRQQDGRGTTRRPGQDRGSVPTAGGAGQAGILDWRTKARDETRAGTRGRRRDRPGRRPWHAGAGQHL